MKARWERLEGEREDVRLGESAPAFSLFPSSTARLLLWDGCEGAFLSEREQKTQFGSARYCLYGRNKNKNPGDEVCRKEVVALDKCQTVTQFILIL